VRGERCQKSVDGFSAFFCRHVAGPPFRRGLSRAGVPVRLCAGEVDGRQTGEASLTARASIVVNSNPQTIQSCPDPGSQPRLASTTTPPTCSLRLPRRLHRGHVSCSEPDACHIAQEHSTVVSAAVACDPGPRNLVLCDTSKTRPHVHLIISTKTKTSSYEPSRYTGWPHPSFVRQEWRIIGLSSFPIALTRYFPSRPRRSLQNHEHADKTSSDLDRTF